MRFPAVERRALWRTAGATSCASSDSSSEAVAVRVRFLDLGIFFRLANGAGSANLIFLMMSSRGCGGLIGEVVSPWGCWRRWHWLQ